MNKQNIFYADDDVDDLDFFREIVEEIGDDFRVFTKDNGNDLLNALETPPPHPNVVFLDINMPGINGLDILKVVRQNENHKGLPIVMFSTSNDEAVIDRARQLGASYYLPKSGDFKKLKKSLEHVLSIQWNSFIPTEQNFVYQYQ